MKWHK